MNLCTTGFAVAGKTPNRSLKEKCSHAMTTGAFAHPAFLEESHFENLEGMFSRSRRHAAAKHYDRTAPTFLRR